MITCVPVNNVGTSVVFLWDRDTSLLTLSESITWGQGLVKVMGNVNGTPIGVSLSSDTSRVNPRIAFKYLTAHDLE